MKCDGCKYAVWDRTPTGRLSPKGMGACTYVVTVPDIPFAFSWPGQWGKKEKAVLSGGRIERGYTLAVDCPVREDA